MFFAAACARIFTKMHNIETKSVIGRKIYCLFVCCLFFVYVCVCVRACVCAHFSARKFYRLEAVKGLSPNSRNEPHAERELHLITSRFPGFPCPTSDCLPARDKSTLLLLTFGTQKRGYCNLVYALVHYGSISGK